MLIKRFLSGLIGRDRESARGDADAAAAWFNDFRPIVPRSWRGGSACRYESGLSCIDVVRVGGAVHLYADRTRQAAERIVRSDGNPAVSHKLVLPYTQWLWARMEHDLGPAPSVLFIGGGGYTLPSKLLESRPAAQAVAVEIDPLVTRVARLHMPWAGETIERAGYHAGRGREGGAARDRLGGRSARHRSR
jgi:spermidine synthase